MMQINTEVLDRITLKSGSHGSRDEGVCAMEMAAWIAGEPHSDHPQCVSPVIGTFIRRWNDSLRSDADRDRLLKPLLPRIIGTATTPAADERRAWMACDWLIREYTPPWLELAGLGADAAALRALPEIRDMASVNAARAAIAGTRARAGAARVAAWAAAWDAAWDAAAAAARVAAGERLAPTVANLQESAAALVVRMCHVPAE